MECLHEVNWLHLGVTDEYANIKKAIAHVCRDVTGAACIDEICINDIVQTFHKHGYKVEKFTDGKVEEKASDNTAMPKLLCDPHRCKAVNLLCVDCIRYEKYSDHYNEK